MKTFFVALVLVTKISWAVTNPADRNGLDAVLNSAFKEQHEAYEKYNQTEIAKRYYQEQFNPSFAPEIISVGERETVTVETRFNLEAKKSKPSKAHKKILVEQHDIWLERLANDPTTRD